MELLHRVKDMFETKFRLIKESNLSFLGNDPETIKRTVLFVEEQIMLAMNRIKKNGRFVNSTFEREVHLSFDLGSFGGSLHPW